MATFTGSDKAISFLFDMVANIANDYDATSTYAVNDYAIYNGVLYKCTSNILVAEDFTPAHWIAVLVMDEISAGGGGGGSTTLAGLSDVSISSVANNDVLTYDSTLGKWKNAAGGGGGGSSHDYSTTEHVVGTWIDGRNVYEITINCGHNYTGPSSGTLGSYYAVTYDIQSLGAEQVLSIEGFDESGMNFPFFNPLNTQYAVFLYANKNSINIRLEIGFARTNDVYATIRYIKPAT